MPRPNRFAARAALSLACSAALFITGCGAGQASADHNALQVLQQTDVERAGPQDPDQLNHIQKTYDDLANDPDLSKPMQVLVRARQAQFRQERIGLMLSDLRTQELAINRDIADIRRLAMQVSGAQTSVDALKAYDPSAQVQKLQAQAAQIQGSAGQLTWTISTASGDNSSSVTVPTLFASKQEVQNLTNEIQQDQTDADAAHKLSAAKGDEAEMYLRRAEGETGDDQVTDTTNSANDRKDAALADSKAAALENDLDRCKSSLACATQQQSALESALKLVNDQSAAAQTRWASVSDQVQAQQKVQQALIGDDNSPATIAGLLKDLVSRLDDASHQREQITTELNDVVAQLTTIVRNCQQLRSDWLMNARANPDDPDVVVWKQATETLHPMTFGMQLANALETKAAMDGSKVQIDQSIYNLQKGYQVTAADVQSHFKNLDVTGLAPTFDIPGLTDLLDSSRTGIDPPKSLADLPSMTPDNLLQAKQDVDKEFQDSVDAFDPTKFGAIDTGVAADQRRNIALMNGAEANRKWAQFSSAMGDDADAKTQLQAASDLDGQIDPTFELTATASASPGDANGSAAPGVPGGTAGTPPAP